MNDLSLGFTILAFGELRGWKILEVDEGLRFSSQLHCPGDGEKLETLATLVGNEGEKRIRVGCCSACGYVGYIDRPEKKWINEFYLSVWDSAISKKDTEGAVLKLRNQRGARRHIENGMRLARLLRQFGMSQNRFVCEIGCGYGSTLHQIQNSGFQNVIGVENSLHRAEMGKNAYGFEILTGAFEDDTVQKKLKTRAPFGLIYAHHVLEHTYDPAETIKNATALQSEGDFLALWVPNATGEPSVTKLLYFPHLHSFTRDSLVGLLNTHAYEVIEKTNAQEEIFLLARKTKSVIANFREAKVSRKNGALNQFAGGLDLKNNMRGKKRILFSYKALTDKGRRMRYYENSTAEAIQNFLAPYLMALFDKHRHIVPLRSFIVEPLSKRYTDIRESPLEIQFEGNIKLTYK